MLKHRQDYETKGMFDHNGFSTNEFSQAYGWCTLNSHEDLIDAYEGTETDTTEEEAAATAIWNTWIGSIRRGLSEQQRVDSDPVSMPEHYRKGPKHAACGELIECIDVVGEMNFPIGSAMKYLWRYQHKGNPVQDLKKAAEYIKIEIERLEREEN